MRFLRREINLGGLAQRPWLIVPTVAALHMTYGIGLFADDFYDVSHITAVYLLAKTFGWATSPIFIAVAIISIVPMMVTMPADKIHRCLWPQQTVLFIMAASVMSASAAGHYPDGTIKNGLYIFIDQAWTLYLTLAHLAATLRNARLGREIMSGK